MIDVPHADDIQWTPGPIAERASTDELREILQSGLRVAHERRVLPDEALRRMWTSSRLAGEWKLRRLITLLVNQLRDALLEERAIEAARAQRASGRK